MRDLRLTRSSRALFAGAIFAAVAGQEIRNDFDPQTYQQKIDLAYHPVAVVLGSLVPAVVVGLAVYFFLGWMRRRAHRQ